MTKLSDRALLVPESPFRKLGSYIADAEAKGVKVISLNIGDPDALSPESVQSYKVSNNGKVGYPDASGLPELKQSFADFYKKAGVQISTDDILITTGASEAITYTLLSCCDPGDNILVAEPFYANNYGFCIQAGVELRTIATDIERNFQLPSYEKMRSYVDDRTKVIMITNPSNPIGRVATREDVTKYVRLAKEFDLYLLIDEVYSNFIYDGAEAESFLNLEGLEDQVIIVESVSKRFSLCGVRVGAMITRNVEVMKAISRFAKLRLGTPVLGQKLSIQAFQYEEGYLEGVRNSYDVRRKYIISRLEQIEGIQFAYPNAGFYVFMRLPIDDSDRFCEWLVKDFRYENTTIALCPGHAFYLTPGKGSDEVRIAYVSDLDDIKLAMDCLEQALVEYTVGV